MNINFNPTTLTAFSKWLVGLIGTAVALWQIPSVQTALQPILAGHSRILSIIGAGVVIWGVLHNPVKQTPPVTAVRG